jgi:hypothetical protein
MLSQNSRPGWGLFAMHSNEPQAVWIPTLEDLLEDGLLMIGLLVVKAPKLVAAAKVFRKAYTGRIQMYDDIDQSDRKQLYELCREIGPPLKLVLTVLEGSSVASQLSVLSRYRFDVEVCPSAYRREYSAWSETVQERGALPESPPSQ